MPHELPKAYEPGAIEDKWAEYWVKEGLFTMPTPATGENVFTLLLPPPNVTGRLHMGHMLNQTEMDILTRWQRMSGKHTLWLPGTDHAGIATQMMVERQLASEGKKRQQMGREAFIERVWEWRRHYGGAILDQMKRLGASVDWQREYFTMDDNLSRGVREAFVRLHEKGLIYRGKYIVNWCPRCVTAISDLEVIHEETAGKLYEIRYPIIGTNDHIVVATTRPETMLGDTAIAVNPNDERYRHLVGKKVRVPGTRPEREIIILADEWANPEFGTGAVKVTPSHDPNDFAIGQRHNLQQLNVMDEHARMNENAGAYQGLDRYAAREKIVADLEAAGLLAKVKDHTLAIGKCDRCKTVAEPRLSTQWFVRVEGKMAQRAIAAVKQGHIQITPENHRTIYLNWMENIHDWCISRQLWWGHRIPAWHCSACSKDTVAREVPQQCAHCGSANIEQDQDVLDTWFSSGLLPFTVFGWPEKTRDLEVFYPTSLLVTGSDILFFWVARMIMLGCWFMGEEEKLDLDTAEGQAKLAKAVPFKAVYIHSLVRDAERQKMSKTKGNVLDPIEVIQQYGTDAVRFTLASLAAPGTDIAFNADRVEGYRAFANKIWNAARFIFMHRDKAAEAGLAFPPVGEIPVPATLEDKWILARFHAAAAQVDAALAEYRFHEAAHVVYHFFWGEFCDWYIEIVKSRLNMDDSAAGKQLTADALGFSINLFENALRLLSPFMPFITEEVWQAVYDGKTPRPSIALASYPRSIGADYANDVAQMALLQALIVDIRAARADMKIEPKIKVPVQLFVKPQTHQLIEENAAMVQRLANVASIEYVGAPLSSESGARVSADYEARVIYEQKIDVAAERDRIQKELAKMQVERANAEKQLSNEQFLGKAPAKVVEGIRKRAGELDSLIAKAQAALDGLK